jgi:hypothetical protein
VPLSILDLSPVSEGSTPAAALANTIDLGLGRSGQRRQEARKEAARKAAAGEAPKKEARIVDGLLIPSPYSSSHLLRSPRFGLQSRLLQQPGARSPDFSDQLDEIRALLAGTHSEEGFGVRATPGAGGDAEIWILGSSAGQSAQVAGALGLPFAANYHVSPATVPEAVGRLPGRVQAVGDPVRAARAGVGRRRRRADR